MHRALLFSILLALAACQVKSGSSEFYTWVDESGQMRTERVTESSTPSEVSSDSDVSKPDSPKSAQTADSTFNPDDYQSSEVVDARLRDARLFAWQDESGKQNVEQVETAELERESADQGLKTDLALAATRGFSDGCCEKLVGASRYLWSDLAGREIKLKQYYSFEDTLSSDALVLDLADFEGGSVRIKSFIREQKLALPDVLLLDERFQLLQALITPFTHFVEESWASYGYMQGQIGSDQLERAEYLVILPSKQLGVLELGGEATKITDLGSILVQRDAPNS